MAKLEHLQLPLPAALKKTEQPIAVYGFPALAALESGGDPSSQAQYAL